MMAVSYLHFSLCNITVLRVSVVNYPTEKANHRDTKHTENTQRFQSRDTTRTIHELTRNDAKEISFSVRVI